MFLGSMSNGPPRKHEPAGTFAGIDVDAGESDPCFTLDDVRGFGEVIRGAYPAVRDTSPLETLVPDTGYEPETEEGHRSALRWLRDSRNRGHRIGGHDAARADRIIEQRAGDPFGPVVRRAVMIFHVCTDRVAAVFRDQADQCARVSVIAEQLRQASFDFPQGALKRGDLQALRNEIVPIADALRTRGSVKRQ